MDDLEARQRAAVIKEATSWLRTPYRHAGRVKGVGVDCAMIIAETFAGAGLVQRINPEQYPPDWHLHRAEERYLKTVTSYAKEIPGPGLPGDIVMFKFGRCFSHGGIVIKWPVIIHAFLYCPVQQQDASRDHRLLYMGEAGNRPRPKRFFTLWPNGGREDVPLACGPDNGKGGA